ncbi:MAG: methyltransferase domain-containing protein [Pseudomonadales bacterium]|nr:methyltransferase domain-containing protein [Pseudomonadales bacterium]
MDVKASVLERYSGGAKEREESLCCPVDYDTSLLKILPQEIIDKDYGCGDPSRYVQVGDIVLDLGSGGGKICYMAAQLVGDEGKVIGVDMNDDMLELAKRHQADMAEKLGGDKVEFRKGHIQDLALSLDSVETFIKRNPIETLDELEDFELWKRKERVENPMVEDESVTLVVSNCVLNLVANEDRTHMINEIFRVLKPGGRVAISDIVSDELVPEHLQKDPHLWSGCISGAFEEKEFIQAFLDAGFIGVAYDKWDGEPWQVVEDIEFRSVTLTAYKPVATKALDAGQAVIYKGPFKEVYDEYGRVYKRGDRVAVSERFFDNITQGAYKDHFIAVEPKDTPQEKQAFCAKPGTLRPVKETKGGVHNSGENGGGCC